MRILNLLLLLSFLACNKNAPSAQVREVDRTQPPIASVTPDALSIFAQVAKMTVPSVVNISTTTTVRSPFIQGAPDDIFRKFFDDFFGPGWGVIPPSENPNLMPKAISLGTGFVIDKTGLILTNNHVVAGADEIKITFTEAPDERPTDGEVAGRDSAMDVALIRVKSKREMVPLPLGDSDKIEVGEYVMAIGNPFGQGHSVTHGIISAKGRVAPIFPLATYIQTDAPINPGNSGGPLINLKGEVIGINNAIQARAQGIGFAIPINAVKQTLDQLKSRGKVERGYIGVVVSDLSPDLAEKLDLPKATRAPLITAVTPGDPADRAGIKPYDVIVEVNGKPIQTSTDLILAITSIPVGDYAKLKLLRAGREINLSVQISARPSPDAPERERKNSSSNFDIGMDVETLTPERARFLQIPENISGVLVRAVRIGGAAHQAGLSTGDVIIEVDRKSVKNEKSFRAIVKEKKSYLLRVRKFVSASAPEAFVVVVLDLREQGGLHQ